MSQNTIKIIICILEVNWLGTLYACKDKDTQKQRLFFPSLMKTNVSFLLYLHIP